MKYCFKCDKEIADSLRTCPICNGEVSYVDVTKEWKIKYIYDETELIVGEFMSYRELRKIGFKMGIGLPKKDIGFDKALDRLYRGLKELIKYNTDVRVNAKLRNINNIFSWVMFGVTAFAILLMFVIPIINISELSIKYTFIDEIKAFFENIKSLGSTSEDKGSIILEIFVFAYLIIYLIGDLIASLGIKKLANTSDGVGGYIYWKAFTIVFFIWISISYKDIFEIVFLTKPFLPEYLVVASAIINLILYVVVSLINLYKKNASTLKLKHQTSKTIHILRAQTLAVNVIFMIALIVGVFGMLDYKYSLVNDFDMLKLINVYDLFLENYEVNYPALGIIFVTIISLATIIATLISIIFLIIRFSVTSTTEYNNYHFKSLSCLRIFGVFIIIMMISIALDIPSFSDDLSYMKEQLIIYGIAFNVLLYTTIMEIVLRKLEEKKHLEINK